MSSGKITQPKILLLDSCYRMTIDLKSIQFSATGFINCSLWEIGDDGSFRIPIRVPETQTPYADTLQGSLRSLMKAKVARSSHSSLRGETGMKSNLDEINTFNNISKIALSKVVVH